MENRIKSVMASVFDVEVSEIREDASPDSIVGWDSLKQMSLVLALEEEFNVTFTDAQTVEMLNYKLIRMVVEEATQKV